MVQTARRSRKENSELNLPAVVGNIDFEEASPFGLQGLSRGMLTILKPECINKLAVLLAMRATPEQIRDDAFIATILSRQPKWVDEYRVVHLIEKSLWIGGQSDLVMTLVKNPSQIPDNPPLEIQQTLSRSYALHPDATVWYGVPLFSDEKNADGLPIPLTAAQVREEAARRIEAARTFALRWGWAYKSGMRAARVPADCYKLGLAGYYRVKRTAHVFREHYRKARRDAQLKARAAIRNQMLQCRLGREMDEVEGYDSKQSRPLIEKLLSALFVASEIASWTPMVGSVVVPPFITYVLPMIISPLPIIACDPFLFVELPDEPGKLRHLGHWYWQDQEDGTRKLHLHT